MKKLTECVNRTDWIGIGMGVVLAVSGIALTLTWVGAILGIPMFLGSIEMLSNNKTLVGTPCAA